MSTVAFPELEAKRTTDVVEAAMVTTIGTVTQPRWQGVLLNAVVATRIWHADKNKWSSLRYRRFDAHDEAFEFYIAQCKSQARLQGPTGEITCMPVPCRDAEAKAARNGWLPKWLLVHGLEAYGWNAANRLVPEPKAEVPEPDPDWKAYVPGPVTTPVDPESLTKTFETIFKDEEF